MSAGVIAGAPELREKGKGKVVLRSEKGKGLEEGAILSAGEVFYLKLLF